MVKNLAVNPSAEGPALPLSYRGMWMQVVYIEKYINPTVFNYSNPDFKEQ